MLLYRIILFFGLAIFSYSTRSIRSSHFIVTQDRIYQPSSALSFLTNLSSITTADCATACLSHNPCKTATFYSDRNICSLFDEPSSLGTTPSQSGALLLTMDPPIPCINSSTNITLLNLFNVSTINYIFYSYSYKTCATSATITFTFRHDVDSWCLDDVVVWNGSYNMLVNGDFETGNEAGWNHQNPSNNSNPGNVTQGWNSTPPHTGNYSYIDGIYGNYDYLSQTFATIPNYRYNISFWLRSNAYANQSSLVVAADVSIIP